MILLRELCGILCIDKPDGFTSFDVVAKLRGIATTKRVGHAGTLDPMATGVLPLFFGRATKACDILPRQDKRYAASFKLGISTDTQDITGKILTERPAQCSEAEVREAAAQFTGDIMQVPPMYSAVRVDGKRLYDLARQGVEVERAARPVNIHELTLLSFDPETQTGRLDVHCSKGTYIRTLIHDLGESLGCGAAMTALRRTMAAGFVLADCISIVDAQAAAGEGRFSSLLLPVEKAFSGLAHANLNEKQTKMFLNGVRMDAARIACKHGETEFAVYADGGQFLGTAAIADETFYMTKLFTLEV